MLFGQSQFLLIHFLIMFTNEGRTLLDCERQLTELAETARTGNGLPELGVIDVHKEASRPDVAIFKIVPKIPSWGHQQLVVNTLAPNLSFCLGGKEILYWLYELLILVLVREL